jgi:hypothetical protein
MSCSSERCLASCGGVENFSLRISHYASNSLS